MIAHELHVARLHPRDSVSRGKEAVARRDLISGGPTGPPCQAAPSCRSPLHESTAPPAAGTGPSSRDSIGRGKPTGDAATRPPSIALAPGKTQQPVTAAPFMEERERTQRSRIRRGAGLMTRAAANENRAPVVSRGRRAPTRARPCAPRPGRSSAWCCEQVSIQLRESHLGVADPVRIRADLDVVDHGVLVGQHLERPGVGEVGADRLGSLLQVPPNASGSR
jgi:hypothetical protein